MERELPLEDEERVGVLAMDVPRRSALARPVVELGDRDLVGVDEHGRPPLRTVGDALAFGSSRSADDDEPGST